MAVWKQRAPVVEPFIFASIEEKISKIRGIEDLSEWLNPTKKSLHDPYLIDNIETSAKRIVKAINNNEKIVVSFDTDSDGLNSGTIMTRYLKTFTNNVSYIYHQRSQGHGISKQIVPQDTDLLIIVDSSTNEVDTCKELQKDIIIIDHHPQELENPYCILVNNNAFNSKYPNKELSGAGMVYKVIQVIDNLMDIGYHEFFIDLAGIGIYGDAMSMAENENRYFVYSAMQNINNPGIKAILQLNNVTEIDSSVFGYTIVPTLNACARLDEIELAIKLLLEDDYAVCLQLAKEAKRLNESRKSKEQSILRRLKKDIDNSHSIIIVKDDKISKGFNGLIAGKLANTYQKPAIVVDLNYVGSARSYNNIPMKSLCTKSGFVKDAQGHETAHGVELEEKYIEQLYNYFDEILKDYKEDIVIEYDLDLSHDEVNKKTIEIFEQFNYLAGKDVPIIKVKVSNVILKEHNVLGKNQDTVKFKTNIIDMVKFRTNENYGKDITLKFDVIGQLQLNKWLNRNIPQMIIEDYVVIYK